MSTEAKLAAAKAYLRGRKILGPLVPIGRSYVPRQRYQPNFYMDKLQRVLLAKL